jgi:pimeloyl-ACP methyl ester carboxylesterase
VQIAIRSGGTILHLEVEEFGVAARGTVLLIMGLGTQLIAWPLDLCQSLARAGYRVIRFDNRDVGLSSKFTIAGVPNPVKATLRRLLGLPVRAPYDLRDMAQDVIGLLDALNIERAHLVGASMGGMIAQLLAAEHAARVASLALIMSSPGAPLPWDSTAAARRVLMARAPPGASQEDLVAMRVNTYRVIGGARQTASDADLQAMARLSVERSSDGTGSVRQLVATQKTGSLKSLLPSIAAPTLIIHGLDDPLIPAKRGIALHRGIKDSTLLLLEGMGHNLPRPLLPKIGEAILANCARLP